MPAPSTIVTFTDADGDEFPVRLPGRPAQGLWERGMEGRAAERELDEQVERGDCNPTMPVTITKVEAA